jgi:hypothetical protein
VYKWLAAVLRCQTECSSGSCSTGTRLGSQQLLCWLQRECLLLPASCQQDAAAAVRWCRTAMQH